MWEMIGFMASILSASTFVPEVMQALKTRHLRDMAWGMLLILGTNCILWIIYATYFHILPVLLSSTLNLLFAIILASIKWRSKNTQQLNQITQVVKVDVNDA